MRMRLHTVGAALLSFTSLSCTTPAALAENVRLRVTVLTAAGAMLEYEYELVNGRAHPIFVPACAQRVYPDFAVATTPPDRHNGAACIGILAMGSRRVEAGHRLTGQGLIARRAGVTYEPSLLVSAVSELRAAETVRAPRFVSP